MLQVGGRIPGGARVWTAPQESATLDELVAGGPVLFLFYLFDWSAT